MSLFDDTLRDIESFGEEFDRTMCKIELLREYAESTLKIQTQEAYLKEKTEEITFETALDVITEARKAASEKAAKSTAATKRNGQEYMNKVSASLSKLTGEADETLKKAKKICKDNPAVGKQKVEYKDYSKEIKEIEAGEKKLTNLIARCRSKKDCTEADLKEANAINDEVNKKRNNIKPEVVAASAVVAVAALATGAHLLRKDANKKAENIGKIPTGAEAFEPGAANRFGRLLQMKINFSKESMSCKARQTFSLRDALSSLFYKKSGKKGIESENLHGNFTKESEELDMYDPDFDARKELDEIMESVILGDEEPEEVTDEETNVTESAENTEAYMDNLEKEFFGESAEGETEFEAPEDLDVDALLKEAAIEAGLEEEVEENADIDELDVDALIEEAADEAGLNDPDPYTESVESLLDDFEDLI